MLIYKKFIRRLIRDYLIGSTVAVLGVSSIFIFSAIKVPNEEAVRLLVILLISLIIMIVLELFAFYRHLSPIRNLFQQSRPSVKMLEKVYLHTHRFPILTVKRIFLPHFFGLSVPAAIMMVIGIQRGYLSLPYSYLILALIGIPVVTCMHALIEFFLTALSIRPIAVFIRQLSLDLYGIDISLNGKVLISVQRKFLFSSLLLGIFPLVLFILSGYIRQDLLVNQTTVDYWNWAIIVLLTGIGFSACGAWVLSREIQHPVRTITQAMAKVQKGDFEIRAADIYSDEFSKMVAGFNHMVNGLKARESMNKLLIQSYFTTLAAALDARDPYTAGHSERVARFAMDIGKLSNLPEYELDILKKTALLHDIGKIGVRDTVLLKEGKLTAEEYEIIKLHPTLGEKILRQIEPDEAMKDILPGVRSHHERYDGGGYPDGLTGEDIPLTGRIIAIADSFDAMTSDRPYRKGMTMEKALQILEEGRGTQWDPRLTRIFIQCVNRTKLELEKEIAVS
jgi:HD-GYP domain-containing protein (c-di-GMP phosphodiesterase class II)